jgi:uncharacterized membrane protein
MKLKRLVLAITSINVLLLVGILIDPENVFASQLFRLYGKLCHQGGEIQVLDKTLKLPLCYRCLGIHICAFLGGWIYTLHTSRKTLHLSLLFLCVCTLPMIIDGVFEISRHFDYKIMSFVTGSMFGFACIVCILQGLESKSTRLKP